MYLYKQGTYISTYYDTIYDYLKYWEGLLIHNYTIYSTQLGLNKQSPKYTLYFYVNNTYARRTPNENTVGSDNTIKLDV